MIKEICGIDLLVICLTLRICLLALLRFRFCRDLRLLTSVLIVVDRNIEIKLELVMLLTFWDLLSILYNYTKSKRKMLT
jgi:hypothetical protein